MLYAETIAATGTHTIAFADTNMTIGSSVKYWENDFGYDALNGVATVSAGLNLSFQRASFAYGLQATRMDMIGNLTVVASTAGSFTISAAMYTMAGSTMSLASSASLAVTWNSGTNSTAASIYGGQSGTRWRSLGVGTWAITPGEYMMGVMISGAGVAGTTGSLTLYGGSGISLNADPGQVAHSAYFADGLYSAGTSAFPASAHLSVIVQTGASALAQPYVRLAGTF